MDPNEALRLARGVVEKFHQPDDDSETDLEDLRRLVEAFDALDGWLSRGGFLPEEWER